MHAHYVVKLCTKERIRRICMVYWLCDVGHPVNKRINGEHFEGKDDIYVARYWFHLFRICNQRFLSLASSSLLVTGTVYWPCHLQTCLTALSPTSKLLRAVTYQRIWSWRIHPLVGFRLLRSERRITIMANFWPIVTLFPHRSLPAAKTGPVFWLQERTEEVVLWRKAWTGVGMAARAF